MAPPDLRTASSDDAASAAPAVPVLVALTVLKKRADFVAAASARRQASQAFILQARERGAEEAAQGIRVGFTCSKKVGNAVARNRAKRRLRAVARAVLPHAGRAGWDYVLIGRRDETARRPFSLLLSDLEAALARIHRDGRRAP